VEAVHKELNTLIATKASTDQVQQTMQNTQELLAKHLEQVFSDARRDLSNSIDEKCKSAVQHEAALLQSANPQGGTSSPQSVVDDRLLSEMEKRMRAVQVQLVKLVDAKVDPEQLDQKFEQNRKEISEQVDKSVSAVQKELRSAKKELVQMVETNKEEMNKKVEGLNNVLSAVVQKREQKDVDGSLENVQGMLTELSQVGRETSTDKLIQEASRELKQEEEEYPDDWRASRVRHLLSQMVHSEDHPDGTSST